MAIKTGIIFCTLLLGSLAVPVPEDEMDMSIFFENTIADVHEGGRIVGGTVAANGAHPWIVAFTTGGVARSAHCGGSIISSRTVLTAAHCIVPVRTIFGNINSNVRLNVGTNIRNSGGQSLSASGGVIHPQYNSNTIKNDIGVLYTNVPISFNNLVSTIPVSFDNVGGGVLSRVAGWGRTTATAPAANQLLQLEVPTLTGPQCVSGVLQASIDLNTRAPAVDPNVEICTFIGTGRGTCRGDSGSPLVRIDQGQQIGIVSWGFPCALGAPDMYVRVSAFRSWLESNTIA